MLALLGAVFYVLLKDNDIDEITAALRGADIACMAAAQMCALMYVVLSGVSIKIILKSLGIAAKAARCIKYSFIGFFFNAITPSATGGQPMQVLYMKNDGINMGASSVTLLFWTIIYKTALIVIEAFAFILMPRFALKHIDGHIWLFAIGILVNVVSIFLYSAVVFSKNGARNIAYFATWLLHKIRIIKKKEKIEKKLDRLLTSYKDGAEYMRSHFGTAAVILAVTIAQRIFYFMATWFIYEALGGGEYSCAQITVLQSFVSVCIDILPLPGGVGVNEGFFVTLFAPAMGKSGAVSAMLLSRGTGFYVILAVSALVTLDVQLRQMRGAKKKKG